MEMIKVLHILGVSIFIGNIIVSAFWKVMADRSKELSVIKYATKLVNLTDMFFTGIGATMLIISGHIMAKDFGGVLSQDWIFVSYALFGLSGFLWLIALVPIQIKQAKIVKNIQNDMPVPEEYYKLTKLWSIIGTVAIIVPLPAIFFMINKTL